jgi:hypothetical protein
VNKRVVPSLLLATGVFLGADAALSLGGRGFMPDALSYGHILEFKIFLGLLLLICGLYLLARNGQLRTEMKLMLLVLVISTLGVAAFYGESGRKKIDQQHENAVRAFFKTGDKTRLGSNVSVAEQSAITVPCEVRRFARVPYEFHYRGEVNCSGENRLLSFYFVTEGTSSEVASMTVSRALRPLIIMGSD